MLPFCSILLYQRRLYNSENDKTTKYKCDDTGPFPIWHFRKKGHSASGIPHVTTASSPWPFLNGPYLCVCVLGPRSQSRVSYALWADWLLGDSLSHAITMAMWAWRCGVHLPHAWHYPGGSANNLVLVVLILKLQYLLLLWIWFTRIFYVLRIGKLLVLSY